MLIGLASSAWPLVWRVLLSGILVVLIYTVALRIHKPSDEQHTAFVPPPRSLYTKQWVPFNSDAVSALAAWRMGLYRCGMPSCRSSLSALSPIETVTCVRHPCIQRS